MLQLRTLKAFFNKISKGDNTMLTPSTFIKENTPKSDMLHFNRKPSLLKHIFFTTKNVILQNTLHFKFFFL